VRVLSHEIMNSITPVASLAKVAVDIVGDTQDKLSNAQDITEELADVQDAVQTVAKRSESLMTFVDSYRQLTRLPPPNKELISLTVLFKQIERLVKATNLSSNLKLTTQITPTDLDVTADKNMLEQVLINLMKNAEQAISTLDSPHIILSALLNKRGHVVIEVSDNGLGIAKDIAEKIFVPFFTTKKEGSGVGLALTRQVMNAHGGEVKLVNTEKGAKFCLTF